MKQKNQFKTAGILLTVMMVFVNAISAVVLTTAATLIYTETAWAMEAGTYLVTVSPSYTDPETGAVEDPGNNEAIGQGMTQKLCGPQGLLEVDASGTMYLTVRYYLSQFVTDVSFEERYGGAYYSCSYEKTQVKDPVSGSGNLDEKYGYTDYRIPIQNMNSVFRGKAYIEPMGRNVVYFFQVSGPVAGSGDFITTMPAKAQTDEGESIREEERGEEDEGMETDRNGNGGLEEPGKNGETAAAGDEEGERSFDVRQNGSDNINGSGDADAPVTGIPEKPVISRIESTVTGFGSEESNHLKTNYDLSAVPVMEARKLTEPLLENATGITLTVGQLPKASLTGDDIVKESRDSTNRHIMLILLGISLLFLIRFAAAFFLPRKRIRNRVLKEDETGGEEYKL